MPTTRVSASSPSPIPPSTRRCAGRWGNSRGDLLVGVINSIGVRRDAEALSGLTKLLRGEDLRVASAAAAALGRIGTPEAASVLEAALQSDDKELRGAVGDACLQCAEFLSAGGKRDAAFALYDAVRGANLPGHLQMAGLRGAILARGAKGVPILVRNLQGKNEASFALALTVARELPGPEATSGIVGVLATLPIERRALVIRALGDRRDRGALAAVLEAVGGPEEVRMEAVVALRQLGDASAVPVLLEVATETEGEIGEAARVTLSRLAGEGVDRTKPLSLILLAGK